MTDFEPAPFATPDVADPDTVTLFDGDCGQLTYPQRLCLTRLLRAQLVTADEHPDDWAVLLRHAPLLRSRLNDLFLDLTVDVDRGVAWKRQLRPDGLDTVPILMRATPWGREATALLIFLRQRYQSERASGLDRVYVDREECVEQVTSYLPADSPDKAADRTRALNAMERLRLLKVLAATGDEQRWEISGVIEALLTVDQCRALIATIVAAGQPGAGQEENQ